MLDLKYFTLSEKELHGHIWCYREMTQQPFSWYIADIRVAAMIVDTEMISENEILDREMISEDEPDVFYDCSDEDYDRSLQSVGDNFYQHVADGNWFVHHAHHAGQISSVRCSC